MVFNGVTSVVSSERPSVTDTQLTASLISTVYSVMVFVLCLMWVLPDDYVIQCVTSCEPFFGEFWIWAYSNMQLYFMFWQDGLHRLTTLHPPVVHTLVHFLCMPSKTNSEQEVSWKNTKHVQHSLRSLSSSNINMTLTQIYHLLTIIIYCLHTFMTRG